MLDVISIGAINVDLIAKVNRFPSEDEEIPVEELSILHGGSAANTAVGVSRLGHPSGFVGAIGTDHFGEMLAKELKRERVDVSHLIQLEGSSGMVFAAINPNGERILYTSKGVSEKFNRSFVPVDYVKETRFLHITSLIGDEALDALEFASQVAFDHCARVILDPGLMLAERGLHILKEILKKCHIVMPSQIEAETLTDLKEEKAGKKLLEYGPEVVIITKGSKGAVLVTRDSVRNFPAVEVQAIDTTGAGDAFAAGFMSALLEHKQLEEASKFANLGASLSVIKRGARTIPRKEEIKV